MSNIINTQDIPTGGILSCGKTADDTLSYVFRQNYPFTGHDPFISGTTV
jgi:hypothetical protein